MEAQTFILLNTRTCRQLEHIPAQQIFVYSQALQFPKVSQPAKQSQTHKEFLTPPASFQRVTSRRLEGTVPLPIISLEFVLQLEQTGELFLPVFTQQRGIASPLGAVCQAGESSVGGSHQNLQSLKDTGLRVGGQPKHVSKTD